MKILFAADGSQNSIRAASGLCDHVAWFREPPSLTVVHVHPPLPHNRATAAVGKAVIAQYYDEESIQALEPVCSVFTARNIAFDVLKLVGDVSEEICSRATSGGYELIVMGTRGHTGIKNLVLGSVATKVLACSRTPVLLFGDRRSGAQAPGSPRRRTSDRAA